MMEEEFREEAEARPQAQSAELNAWIYEANTRLEALCLKYLTAVNSNARVFVDQWIDSPESGELGERIGDPEAAIRERVDSVLSCCRMNEEEALRDFAPGEKAADRDERELRVHSLLLQEITDILTELLQKTKAELYALTESAAEKYVGEDYHVFLEIVGYIRFQTPEDCWAVLSAEWYD